MSNPTTNSHIAPHVFGDLGVGRISAMCKQILNDLVELANRPAERRRFAALSLRQLEDIGMTVAERDALLR